MASDIREEVQKMLNTVRVPDDAGEYEESITKILQRIPDGWGRMLRCSAGWYPLIVELDAALTAIDPNYQVYQVKEKFGVLRYYCSLERNPEVREQISRAEALSAVTCEVCGRPGTLRTDQPWVRTLCDTCAESRER